jgi:excisionase family DNA binding protein
MNSVSVPSLDELAANPERVGDVSPDVAANLLAKLAGVQTILLTKVLAGSGNGEKSKALADALLTVPEVAARLKVPSAYAYELARRGEIPTLRIGKKYVRVPHVALQEWVAQGLIPQPLRPSRSRRG